MWQKLLVAIALGTMVGVVFRENTTYIYPIGQIFVNLIKMLIVPLIFASITTSITSMTDMESMGRLGIKSALIFLGTTVIAAIFGIFFAEITNLGQNVTINLENFAGSAKAATIAENSGKFSVVKTIVGIIPTNPASAMANAEALQIIVFAIFLGISINLAGQKGKKLGEAIESLAEVMYTLTNIVMKFAPYGVFALVGWLVGTQDPKLLGSMTKLIAVGYFVLALQIILVFGGLATIYAKVNPVTYFKRLVPVMLFGYTTSSSSATLPLTIKVAQNKIGISKLTSSFVLPLGTTINMNGTSIIIGLYTLFLAGIFGVEITFSHYIIIIMLATLVSIGTAGIPSGSLVMLSTVLMAVGLDAQQVAIGIGMILAIDRILDMARTVVNIAGDVTTALICDKMEDRFNDKILKTPEDDLPRMDGNL